MDDHNLFKKRKFWLQSVSFYQVKLHKNVRKLRDFYNPYCMYNGVYKLNRCHIRRSPLRVSPNQGPARRPMRGRLEEHLDHLNIREEAGGIVWVNPSSKCASCHSNETDQRNLHTHVNVSLEAYVYDETIYNSCARARFAGCTYLRHIILGLKGAQV